MSEGQAKTGEAAARRIIELEEEVEASGFAALDADSVAWVREQLHLWVDSVTGSIISPGLGRVTLMHGGERESVIASPQLAFLLSKPVR